MDWSITTPYPDIIPGLFSQFVRVAAVDRDMARIAATAQRAGSTLAILDAQLAGQDFILGKSLTMADIAVGSLLYRYFTLPITRPSWSSSRV